MPGGRAPASQRPLIRPSATFSRGETVERTAYGPWPREQSRDQGWPLAVRRLRLARAPRGRGRSSLRPGGGSSVRGPCGTRAGTPRTSTGGCGRARGRRACPSPCRSSPGSTRCRCRRCRRLIIESAMPRIGVVPLDAVLALPGTASPARRSARPGRGRSPSARSWTGLPVSVLAELVGHAGHLRGDRRGRRRRPRTPGAQSRHDSRAAAPRMRRSRLMVTSSVSGGSESVERPRRFASVERMIEASSGVVLGSLQPFRDLGEGLADLVLGGLQGLDLAAEGRRAAPRPRAGSCRPRPCRR